MNELSDRWTELMVKFREAGLSGEIEELLLIERTPYAALHAIIEQRNTNLT